MTAVRSVLSFVSLMLVTLVLNAEAASMSPSEAEKLGKKIMVVDVSAGQGYGGYIFYRYHFNQNRKIACETLVHSPDALTMVDQEGGFVTRILDEDAVPVAMPDAFAMEEDDFFKASVRVAEVLRSKYCINVNLAPVLAPIQFRFPAAEEHVGYERIVEYAKIFERAMLAGGVLPTLKHFPGNTLLSQTLAQTEFSEYSIGRQEAKVVREGYAGEVKDLARSFQPKKPSLVMMSNNIYPAYSPRPAVIEPLYTEWLRRDLGFDGVIISDALTELNLTDEDILIAAQNSDLVLINDFHAQKKVLRLLAGWIESGQLDISEKIRRIGELARR